jgi:hypothetical protein
MNKALKILAEAIPPAQRALAMVGSAAQVLELFAEIERQSEFIASRHALLGGAWMAVAQNAAAAAAPASLPQSAVLAVVVGITPGLGKAELQFADAIPEWADLGCTVVAAPAGAVVARPDLTKLPKYRRTTRGQTLGPEEDFYAVADVEALFAAQAPDQQEGERRLQQQAGDAHEVNVEAAAIKAESVCPICDNTGTAFGKACDCGVGQAVSQMHQSTGYRCGSCCARKGEPHLPGCADGGKEGGQG